MAPTTLDPARPPAAGPPADGGGAPAVRATTAVPLAAPRPTPEHFAHARRLRALMRRMDDAAHAHAHGRARALRRRLLRPLTTGVAALRALRTLGPHARRVDGAGPLRLLLRTWWLGLRHDLWPTFVYLHRLYRDDRWPVAPLFVQQQEADLMYHASSYLLGPEMSRTLNDKRRFADWAREHGLPTPPVLLAFAGGRPTHGAADLAAAAALLPPRDLFAKWGTRGGGDDTQRYRHADGRWTDEAGAASTAAELVATLAARSADGVVLLQPCLYNHPAVATVSPNALSTLRVVTTRRPGGPPVLLLALLRMGVGPGSADNFAQGGIAAPVDLATGTLRRGLQVAELQRSYVYDVHPDSGAWITGFALPHWDAAVRIALAAHERLGDHVVVGWDVALLDDGPVLIEGNWNPGLRLAQLPSGMPLFTTVLGAHFSALLDGPMRGADGATLLRWADWHPLRASRLGLD